MVTWLRSNMKQRLMPLYGKIMLRKRSIIETVNYILKNVVLLVHTRHRSVHNFLINLLAAMGRTASSSPSQQSTSTTRCRTQTVDSPFGNSSNPIFTEAHQAATFMVVRHYPHPNHAFSVHTYPELALLGRPFCIGIFSRR